MVNWVFLIGQYGHYCHTGQCEQVLIKKNLLM
jgi:hypothetical protein